VRKKRKASFEAPDDSALWGVALLKLVKGDFPQQNNIAYIFRIEQWKELWLIFQIVITYFKIA